MNDLLGFVNSGVITAINIIKWISVIFLTFHICILGFNIMNGAKGSSDVITKVKEKAFPLVIGFFMVIACSALQSTIQGFLDDTKGNIDTTKPTDISGTDVDNYFSTSE